MAQHKRPRNVAKELKRLQQEHERDSLSLRHEIHVFQDELIAQNDKLQRAHDTLEETRDRFIELYDSAPNGYLTLDTTGTILQANLAAASLLGRPRHVLKGMPLVGFVSAADRSRLLDFLRRCRAARSEGISHGEEVRIEAAEGRAFDVEIICKVKPTAPGRRGNELLTTIIDVTKRKQLEAERARAMRERATLASRLLSAQDEERQRIARDLHDNLGQQVTALRLLLQVAQMDAGKDRVRDRLTQAESIVEQLDHQLDFVSTQLRPASLDLGLSHAIEYFVREWSSTFAVDATCRCLDLEQGLDPDVETHIYRVMQEALNNVYKHANARCVEVTLERQADDIVLSVADDGRGFEPDTLSGQHDRGLGLVSMSERAQLVGGRIEITSLPSKGTTIVLRVPSAGRTESR